MTITEIENIQHLLKTHYGATKVVVDKDLVFVYGSDVDAVYTALIVEYGSDHDVIYEHRDNFLKEVVLRFVKKNQKVIDNINLMQ